MKPKAKAKRSYREFAEMLTRLMPRMMRSMLYEERNYVALGLIGMPQMCALIAMVEHGPQRMQSLVKLLGLKSSSVTSLVDRLVYLGLAERKSREGGDRRVVLADVTPKGRRILEEIYHDKVRSMEQVLKGLTNEECELFLALHEKMIKVLENQKAKEKAT